MKDKELLNVFLENEEEPLGFVEISNRTTLRELRTLIKQEVEEVPKNFRFIFKNKDVFVRVSLFQEPRKLASQFLPEVTLRAVPSGYESPSRSRETLPQLTEMGLLNTDNLQLEEDLEEENFGLSRVQRSDSLRRLSESEFPKIARKFWTSMDKDTKRGSLPANLRKKKIVHVVRRASSHEDKLKADSFSFQDLNIEEAIDLLSQEEDDPQEVIDPPQELIESPQEITDPLPEPQDAVDLSQVVDSQEAADPLPEPIQQILTPEELEADTREDIETKEIGTISLEIKAIMEDLISRRPSARELVEKKILTDPEYPGISQFKLGRKLSVMEPRSELIGGPHPEWRVEGGARVMGDGGVAPELECQEQYEAYYKKRFSPKPHTHFRGEHSDRGPVIVSVLDHLEDGALSAIVRSQKADTRVFIESAKLTPSQTLKKMYKEQLRALQTEMPDLLGGCKMTPIKSSTFSHRLLEFEQSQVITRAKFGVLYCKDGQTIDDEMYNNVDGSPQFEDFLHFLGDRVKLADHKKYAAGLDTKYGSTGEESVFRHFRNFEIMFHVSTLLPYFPDDHQQVERKRHIGNDVVVIVFNDGKTPFLPTGMKSHFNHVFVVVQPLKGSEGQTKYRVAVCAKREVPPFGPFVPVPGVFTKSDDFLNFLLTKLMNGERAAMLAPSFAVPIRRTRREYLKNLVTAVFDDEVTFKDRAVTHPPPLRRMDSLAHYGGGSPDETGTIQVAVSHPELTIKTIIGLDYKIKDLIAKVEKKFPASHGTPHGIFFEDSLLPLETPLASLKKNPLKVQYKPISGRKVISVIVDSKALSLTTNVDSNILISSLFERLLSKLPDDGSTFNLYKDGKVMDKDKPLSSFVPLECHKITLDLRKESPREKRRFSLSSKKARGSKDVD